MAGGADISTWAAQRLGSLLQMPPGDCGEIVENILAYDDADELRDFLGAFAEKAAEHKVGSFVDELFERRNPGQQQQQRSAQTLGAKGVGAGTGGAGDAPPHGRGRDGKGRSGGGDSGGGRGRGGARTAARGGAEDGEFPRLLMPTRPRDKNDKRMLVIDAASGRHKVLTNCLNCGKVIVEEEGWGPCLFCGNPLETGDSMGVRHGDDRGFAEPTRASTNEEEARYNASFERAKATKDRLLSYDRDAKKRTKVYDDATDWYSESVNPWLNERQREEAKKKGMEEENRKREEKRRIHAKIDFFGRTVVSADAEVAAEAAKKSKESMQEWSENVHEKTRLLSMFEENTKGMGGANSQLSGESKQLYDKLRASLHGAKRDMQNSAWSQKQQDAVNGGETKKRDRWQATNGDKVHTEFDDISTKDFSRGADTGERLLPVEESPYGDDDDSGQCLSMHQPWASLLVFGFKRAEGRSWRAEHRGRLWIHAAAKPPDTGDVIALEQRYREVYAASGVPTPPMPSEAGGYPTSALLGCVDLEECWTKEQYDAVLVANPSMPQEENDCEHIFWCLRPRRLAVPVKMGGDHKIWRLPQASLRQAQRGLQPVRWPAPAEGENLLAAPEIQRSAGNVGPARNANASMGGAGDQSAPSVAASKPRNTNAAVNGAKEAGARPCAPRLDLWPTERPTELLEVVEREKDIADRDVVVLQSGFVHLVGFVPPDLQQRVVDALREPGLSEVGFFTEQFDGCKVVTDAQRMYLGQHWNASTRRWEATRGNMDGAPVAPLPKLFVDLYQEAIARANREMSRGPNKKRKLPPLPDGGPPTLAVVNYYAESGSMQIHQDKTESQESIDAGAPVLCICLGGACDLAYSAEAPSGNKKPKTLRLESGDVYIFGGESRLLWHGILRVLPRSAPPSLRLLPGRLSVTLRVG